MATTLSDMVDLFMTKVNDYRLTAIYSTSGSTALSTYAEPWLMAAIVEFDMCVPPLAYTESTSTDEGYFSTDLSLENKMILAEIMVKYWLQKSVQDILQMNNLVTDHDFRMFSRAQNLDSKRQYYNAKCEEISQMLIRYEYKYNDWTAWKNTL